MPQSGACRQRGCAASDAALDRVATIRREPLGEIAEAGIEPSVGSVGDIRIISWNSKDALLYAVGIGAGQADLPFTTENTQNTPQVVFPTFAVVAGSGTASPGASAMSKIGSFNFALLVHGSQAITLHRPIPVEAEATTQDKVVAMYDKGKAAVVVAVDEAARSRGISANALVRAATGVLGGSGGGKDDVAQGGGADLAQVDEALSEVTRLVRAEVVRRGKAKPCLRIVRRVFAAVTATAGVVEHRQAALERIGWIGPQRPRMYAVQAAGCAPIVRAFEAGVEHAERWEDAHTVAAGIRVPRAVGDFLILRAVRESGGKALAVGDPAIVRAVAECATKDGLLMCPEGGATLAAYKEALRTGEVDEDERVVLFNCATGLKYPLPEASQWLDRNRSIDFAMFD